MLPSLSLTSSSNSATVMVDKATSELLIAPDWTMNMEICDSVNSDHLMAKEIIKSVKRRLQHKNPRVQMLTLTLLETMVKNCGDHIHIHVAERKILDEMIKIVKKRADMQVRSKILMLLDSWQEAFGGPGGKHMQYYWAYDELRRSGVQFPQRSLDAAPIITPPATQPSTRHPQIGLGMPNNSVRRLDEAMASDLEGLSVSALESMRNANDLLADMLEAMNPSDRQSVKDEVIVDIVDRCRSNQRKLMQMLAATLDEELLGQGLELNDAMQVVLAKHDAIASGSPLPTHLTTTTSSFSESPASNTKPSGSTPGGSSPATTAKPSTPSSDTMKVHAEDEEEEDDEFAQLARRHSRPSPVPTRSEDGAAAPDHNAHSNAIVVADPPPPPPQASKEQDMADFLSIVLSTSYTSEPEPRPEPPIQNNVQPTFNGYAVPWAQSQPQPETQIEADFQPRQQPNTLEYSSAYPPPPWAAAPEYANSQFTAKHTSQEANSGFMSTQGISQHQPQHPQLVNGGGVRSLQHSTSFQNPQYVGYSAVGPSPAPIRSLQPMSSMPARGGGSNSGMGQKPYIPSYRLFEDLNVLGNAEPKLKNGPYSASGASDHGMVGGRR